MTTKQENVSAVSAFKVWIFPSLVSIISLLIWNDVNEIKADVKALMAQSNIDKTRIDNLERLVYKKTASLPFDLPSTDLEIESYAILPNRKTIKNKNYEEILF
jgi:hypothetical protein